MSWINEGPTAASPPDRRDGASWLWPDGNRAGRRPAYAFVTFSRPGPTFLLALRVSTTTCDCFTTML